MAEITIDERQAKREALAAQLRREGADTERQAILAFLREEGAVAEQVVSEIDRALGITDRDAKRYRRRLELSLDAVAARRHHEASHTDADEVADAPRQ